MKVVDLSRVEDAPAQIVDTNFVAAENGSPTYCRVEGYVVPHIGFEMKLPENWNGKFLHVGCGAACGQINLLRCEDAVRRGYACIVSDMGHRARSWDGRWSYNNLQAEFDFGIRASHVTALVGKAVTKAFYGRDIAYSYFNGCSNGGLEAMTAAQRFPWDFDGIIAGAPGISETNYYMYMLWSVRNLYTKQGTPLFSRSDLSLLNKAVINACDNDDGLKDGVVGNPSRCRFDPAMIACKPGQSASCLSGDQVLAAQRMYAGAMTSAGKSIVPGGVPKTSELEWSSFYSDDPTKPPFYSKERVADMFRYRAFVPDPGPAWQVDDFDFDHDYKRLGMMEALYFGTNPDLRKFKAAGGKMIVYQGWQDPYSLPAETIDYMDTMEKTMGGHKATMDFARLFMVPGMDHCAGGVGAYAIDYLGALENWVEKGRAPDMLIGAHPDQKRPSPSIPVISNSPAGDVRFPLDNGQTIGFKRPIYPYPSFARYRGKGDASDAANWQRVEKQ